jgi:hypothetical protein
MTLFPHSIINKNIINSKAKLQCSMDSIIQMKSDS